MSRRRNLLVSITGWSGSGKTTFIETCIGRLADMGYRVCAVKSTHMDLELDSPGKDSFRFREAGASGVCLITRGGTAVFYNEGEECFGRERLISLFPDADFILAEGYHGEADLRFEALKEGASIESLKWPLCELDGILAGRNQLRDIPQPEGIGVFPPDDPDGFIRTLIRGSGRT